MSVSIFLASSQESVDSGIIELLEQELDAGGVRVTQWRTSFAPTQYAVEALLENTRSHDSAAFVFARDDRQISRGSESSVVRDNVLLEFGIFLGSLDRSRLFILQEKGVRKPSDLLGLTVLEYSSGSDFERSEALRSCAATIASTLKKLGPKDLPPVDPDGLHSSLDAFDSRAAELRRFLLARTSADLRAHRMPIVLDSRADAISLYQWGLERVQARYWTTSFLKSGFWVNADVAFPFNRRMLRRLKSSSPDVRRLLVFNSDPKREIERIGKEIRDLYRLGRDQEMDDLLSTLHTVRRRHEILESDGCKVKVCQLAPHNRQMRLSGRAFDLTDVELAIFDDWRLDFYPGGRHGVIEGVEVYCAGVSDFRSELHAASELFEEIWYHALPAEDFFRTLDAEIRRSLRKIDCRKNWIVAYEHFLPRRDRELKDLEMQEVLETVRSFGVENGQWAAYLDIGTGTGRYPRALAPFVHDGGLVWGIDLDHDCIRMAQKLAGESRLRFTVNDFLADDFRSDTAFDLVTCMLGTLSYFNFDRGSGAPVGLELRRALRKMHELLGPGGRLVLSNWSEDAVRDRDPLLSIYEAHDSRRLARWTPPTAPLIEALEVEGFEVVRSSSLGRLYLLGCRKVG